MIVFACVAITEYLNYEDIFIFIVLETEKSMIMLLAPGERLLLVSLHDRMWNSKIANVCVMSLL